MENNFEYKSINSKFIISDSEYQRSVDMNRVRKIVSNFNVNLVNPIKVSYRGGKYYVFDGQHTLTSLKLMNNNKDIMVDCKVYKGLTKEEEAKLFSEQTGISKSVKTIDKFKALYIAKDVDICNFKEITESTGIRMDFTGGRADNKIVACSKAFKIYNSTTKEEYTNILKAIKNAWDGNPKSFDTSILGGMYVFYSKYKNEINQNTLQKQLSKVSPIVIIREGKVSNKRGDEKFARQILGIYNKGLKGNRLEDKFI